MSQSKFLCVIGDSVMEDEKGTGHNGSAFSGRNVS